jgi:hypothetical protein
MAKIPRTPHLIGQIRLSTFLLGVLLAVLGNPAVAQAPARNSGPANADEDFHVYTDTPRLLLTKSRLRLLKRERERQSVRWKRFDDLIRSGAPLPEPGFAQALYYRVADDAAAGRKAVEWALSADSGTAGNLRQLALVFDWCGPVMSPEEANRLASKIQQALAAAPPDASSASIAVESARALAAIALADRLKDEGDSILRPLVQQWWRGTIIKQLEAGDPVLPREQTYALIEMFHAIRDNLMIDLRDSDPAYFRQLPIDQLEGNYPAPFPGPDSDLFIPVYVRDGEPDLSVATMSRAAGLEMVAFDTNSLETQYLQGWLMQDRFMLRSPLGAPYEFLWADPYQPGLSYTQLPLVYHNSEAGHVFARTSWDEDAAWIGYVDGHLQLFQDGRVQTLRAGAAIKPLHVGDTVLMGAPAVSAHDGMIHFEGDRESVFVLGLAPRSNYDVEIDNEELSEQRTDVGGTLVVELAPKLEAGVRVRRRME